MAVKTSKELLDPTSPAELAIWLKDNPIEVSRAIAARTALRVIPLLWNVVERIGQERGQQPVAPREGGWLRNLLEGKPNTGGTVSITAKALEKLLSTAMRRSALAWFAAASPNSLRDEVTAALRAAVDHKSDFKVMFPSDTYAAISPDTKIADLMAEHITRIVDLVVRVAQGAARTAEASAADAGVAWATYAIEAAADAAKEACTFDFTYPLICPGLYPGTDTHKIMADSLISQVNFLRSFTFDRYWIDNGGSGATLAALRLQPNFEPLRTWQLQWHRLRASLPAVDLRYEVWISWYERRLDGATFDLTLERQRVLIPVEEWG
jgi:hypothetical protein